MDLRKLLSRIPFLLAARALLVISWRRCRLVMASSPGPVRSLLCSWRGTLAGSVFNSRSCLRSYLARCFLVMAVERVVLVVRSHARGKRKRREKQPPVCKW